MAPRFGIHFFAERVKAFYDYSTLDAATRHLEVKDAVVTLTEEDVEAYWVDAAPSSRILVRLTAQASTQQSAALLGLQETRPFFVTLDGKKLYVGIVYEMGGAAAITTPVVHLLADSGLVELRIGAHQGAWAGGWGTGDASRIDRQEVRDLFEARGALWEMTWP
jgi:hypothetical protein